MAVSKIAQSIATIARRVINHGGIASIESQSEDYTVTSSVYTNSSDVLPWFNRRVNGVNNISGIVLAHTGILHTEFDYFPAPKLVGLTFRLSPTRYYRMCMGISDNKSLFMEYFDGTNTNRIWTANLS